MARLAGLLTVAAVVLATVLYAAPSRAATTSTTSSNNELASWCGCYDASIDENASNHDSVTATCNRIFGVHEYNECRIAWCDCFAQAVKTDAPSIDHCNDAYNDEHDWYECEQYCDVEGC